MRKDTFSGFHPAVNFLYFAAVLAFTMLYMHPVFLAISFVSAMVYSIYLGGRRAWRFNFLGMIPALLVIALINPATSHQGVTILLYIGGNPLTLESIVYGVAAAFMFVSAILWFSCYNAVMTSDKFICLFGRIIPALSLILSMALRFVPRFRDQLLRITAAQRCIGRDIRCGGPLQRVGNGVRILSILVTWALENAMDTADSMKARGYGLRGRTSFSILRFDSRDRLAFAALLCCILAVSACIPYALKAQYYPRLILNEPTPLALAAYLAFGVLCTLPMTINLWEDLKWKRLLSAA